MTWLKSIFSFLTDPIADLTGGYRERKRIAAESTAAIATAEVNLKLAELNAKTRQLELKQAQDFDYDMQVLQNRRESSMDEIIIGVFLCLFLMHFVPALQPYMHKGWAAMGYDGAPWYFEFVIVGIAVSTLGLMRLFRAFWHQKQIKRGRLDGHSTTSDT
ncbi:hypothetical protein EXU30_00100 [Shewanella maritima]|uniref:Uncharacterized protein n=1 Tax=Shewanella maritima TaxID=2520507 RepID=A0A411PD16_9GAMM|nr:hypothetical protein [Shewanella maritima]QBF81270.1 hypothetical protein EXU30_00100 [Shewanella maritima]